mgnify:FL=1
MEPLQKLEALSNQHNLQLQHNDRLFYSKYLYRLEVILYQYRYPELMRVPTIDSWGFKVDTEHHTSFIGTVRKYAKKQGDRVRVEYRTLNYYCNDVATIEKLIAYVNRLTDKQDTPMDKMVELGSIRYFPGSILERNIRYRKKRLPYGKYRFQILGERMDSEQYYDWCNWAKQYPDSILAPTRDHGYRHFGTWCGESIGYIVDEKMLQFVQFKLGSHINKVIEFQLRETE